MVNLTGNRHNERYTFYRVAWENWQEHETYDYILSGSIEGSVDAELKITGSFEFEGYETPNVNDLIRLYYSFTDDYDEMFREPVATLVVDYAELNLVNTLGGVKSSGTLNGTSVLSILQNAKTGKPYTVKKNANAVYQAEIIAREFGLQVNAEPSSFSLTTDHTFEGGVSYLEIINWLLTSASYSEVFPDAMGVLQMFSLSTIQNRKTRQVSDRGLLPSNVLYPKDTLYPRDMIIILFGYEFENNDKSIMFPEIDEANDWQNTPNVVRLLYNLDDACIAAYAKNVSGSRASLDVRGEREITYFEEVSDLGEGSKVQILNNLAIEVLKELSADIEYVTFRHAYVPITIFDPIRIKYSNYEWEGNVDNISIDLSPSTETQTRIKRVLSQDIIIESGTEVLRSEES